ncbi:hypothetical protein FPV67DRAFT_1625505 [Lyophyllum atratum]|nr:hypothetical protein FPV67DRAFT_1625505 [Lyophyllum atratum]
MSGPYVYTPAPGVQHTAPFHQTPYYAPSPHPGTPFIPDSALYPNSPYSKSASLHQSPHRGGIPLPSSAPPDQFAWYRERRPSWHGADDGQWLQAPPTYPIGFGLNRRHSFGASGHAPPQFGAGGFSPNSLFTHFYVNPWINAESPRADFFFDLSLPTFTPLRLYGPGQSGLMGSEEMMQPATHPPITRLRIVCDALPHWPCELQLDPYQTGGYQPPPISLQDVLVAVHRNMHRQITHADWGRLSEKEEVAVSRAFTRRCQTVPTTFDSERAKGVKRVDYLLGKTRMIGLVRVARSEGWDVMKLIVE